MTDRRIWWPRFDPDSNCNPPWLIDGLLRRGSTRCYDWMLHWYPVRKCSLLLEGRSPNRIDHRDHSRGDHTLVLRGGLLVSCPRHGCYPRYRLMVRGLRGDRRFGCLSELSRVGNRIDRWRISRRWRCRICVGIHRRSRRLGWFDGIRGCREGSWCVEGIGFWGRPGEWLFLQNSNLCPHNRLSIIVSGRTCVDQDHTHEQIIGIWIWSSYSKQLHQVMELTMDITTNSNRTFLKHIIMSDNQSTASPQSQNLPLPEHSTRPVISLVPTRNFCYYKAQCKYYIQDDVSTDSIA